MTFCQSSLMIIDVHSTGVSETHQRDSAQQKRLCLVVQSLDGAGYFYCCMSGQTLQKRMRRFLSFFLTTLQKKSKAKHSFRHVRPVTDLGEFWVGFVDGVRRCVNGMSELLLQ